MRLRTKNAPANMAVLEHFILNLIKEIPDNVSLGTRRKTLAWDDRCLQNAIARMWKRFSGGCPDRAHAALPFQAHFVYRSATKGSAAFCSARRSNPVISISEGRGSGPCPRFVRRKPQ